MALPVVDPQATRAVTAASRSSWRVKLDHRVAVAQPLRIDGAYPVGHATQLIDSHTGSSRRGA